MEEAFKLKQSTRTIWQGVATLALSGPLHNVNINVGGRDTIIEIAGHKRYVRKLATKVNGNRLEIKYNGPPERAYDDNPYTEWAMIRYYLRHHKTLRIPGWNQTPHLTITVPEGTALELDGVEGNNVFIGNTHGPLVLRPSRQTSCNVGTVAACTLDLARFARVVVERVAGNCQITTVANTSVKICDGTIDQLGITNTLGAIHVSAAVKHSTVTLRGGSVRLNDQLTLGMDNRPGSERSESLNITVTDRGILHANSAVVDSASLVLEGGSQVWLGSVTQKLVAMLGASTKMHVGQPAGSTRPAIEAQVHVQPGATLEVDAQIVTGKIKVDRGATMIVPVEIDNFAVDVSGYGSVQVA